MTLIRPCRFSSPLILIAVGDKEHAIDELERGYREAAGTYLFLIKVDPLLDPLHGDPRFEALAKKIVSGKQ